MTEKTLDDFRKLSNSECISPENALKILEIAELRNVVKKLDYICNAIDRI